MRSGFTLSAPKFRTIEKSLDVDAMEASHNISTRFKTQRGYSPAAPGLITWVSAMDVDALR